MKKLNQKGSAVVIVLVLLLSVAIAGVGYTIYKNQNESSTASSVGNDDTTSQESSPNPSSSELQRYTAVMFDTTISLSAPGNWEIEKEDDSDEFGGASADTIKVKSPSGLSFEASPNGGVGGNCDPRDDTFTLLNKIDSTDGSVTYVEFSISDGTNEPFGAHENSPITEVGESAADSCNIGYIGVFDGAFIRIYNNGEQTTYSEVIADPEFVEVLKSVSVTQN